MSKSYLAPQKKKGEIAIYRVTGKSFICPTNAPEADTICFSLLPIRKVDPRNLYQYVIDNKGNTVSASKRFLKKFKTVEFNWLRQPFTTAAQELHAQIQQATIQFNHYLNEKRNESITL